MLQSTENIIGEPESGRLDANLLISDNGSAWDALEQPPLVLERLPSGEYAWLRPETGPRYVLTCAGRAALAEAES